MLVIDTRIKLLLFILINFMVFGLKDFILGSVCFFFICILSCLMGQKKIVLKYLIFYVVIAAIQQLCAFLPQAIETILSIFTLFIRVMIPVVLFASTFIANHILSCPFPCRKNLIKGVFEYDSTYFIVLVRSLRCPQLL